jgi:hypothetical protein
MSHPTVRLSDRKTTFFVNFPVRFPDTYLDIYAIGRAFSVLSRLSVSDVLEAETR